MKIYIPKQPKYNLTINVAGDKSISHRAVLFNAIAHGKARIKNLLMGHDVLATIDCLRKLGVDIAIDDDGCTVNGTGLLKPPSGPLDCGNSGTTMRLLLGMLASHPFEACLIGDESLSKRPMRRITKYLEPLGVLYRESKDLPPIVQCGSTGLEYFSADLHIASAQMKSALLLTGLQSKGCFVRGGGNSRDHTERMLAGMGAELIQYENGDVEIFPGTLTATNVVVPNDISSAAFFIVGGILLENATLEIPNVGINPTRDGILRALKLMGANISMRNQRTESGEPVADLTVQSSKLRGIELPEDWIPTMIDEIPILALAATQAIGTTIIKGAADLRKKESDRLSAIVSILHKLGIDIEELEDGLIIQGPQLIRSGSVQGFGDHRIIMTAAIAALVSGEAVVIDDPSPVDTSFPSFWDILLRFQPLNDD